MDLLTLGSFVFFTGLVAFLTWRMTRHHGVSDSSDGYFLAGRGLTGPFIAGSLMLTNLSTEQLVGLNGAAFKDGLSVMAWEVVAAVSLVAMALFFLPRYLRSGIATVPQLLEERFDHQTRMITTVVFVLAYAVIFLPMILHTGATGLIGVLDLHTLTGIESRPLLRTLCVVGIGVLGSVYAIFGGLRSVAVSDTLNGFGLLVGGLLITWFALTRIGGDDGAWAGLQAVREAHPEKFESLGAETQSVPWPTLFTGVLLLNLFYWTTNQQIIQRTFAASSLKEGQKGVLYAGVLKVLAPLILVLPGILAFHLYGFEQLPLDAEGKPIVDAAYGMLVNEVLPKPLAGFFAAVLVGAILSSFNSALNSTATLFSLGVWKHMRPASPERSLIAVGKVVGTVAAVASMAVAPLLANVGSIFGYLQKMNGIYFIPIFAVVLVGLLARRVPAVAAKSALVVGLLAIALGYFVFDSYGMHEFHFLGVVFVGLVVMMLAIGQLQPLAEPWTARGTAPVDMTPWAGAVPTGIALLVVVGGIYFAFA